VLDVHPAIGHGSPTERGGQTGHRGAVSNPGLGISIGNPEAGDHLPLEHVEFVGVRAAADHGDAGGAVHDLALGVGGDEGAVAGVLDVARDPRDGVVPGDVLPAVGAGAADLRVPQAILVRDVVFEGGALGTEGAPADRVVGVAFHVHHR